MPNRNFCPWKRGQQAIKAHLQLHNFESINCTSKLYSNCKASSASLTTSAEVFQRIKKVSSNCHYF